MYILFTIQIYLKIIVHFVYICSMNTRNSKYFVCIANNEAICVDHTLKKLHACLALKIKNLPSYMTVFRKFNELDENDPQRVSLVVDGQEYWLQKVV